MRGYAHKTPDGTVTAVYAGQGRLIDAGDRVLHRLGLLLANQPAGLHRISVVSEGYGDVFTDLGARVAAGPQREAARLRGQLARMQTRARTRSPGIEGYQHAADMATARLRNARDESRALTAWLESLVADGNLASEASCFDEPTPSADRYAR